MNSKPLTIPADILAKYEGQEGQFEAFDKVLTTGLKTPASSIPPVPAEEPKKGRGRPRKGL